MKTVSLALLRKELRSMPQEELAELCLRLVRAKKDNKELVHYLIFEAHDEAGFVAMAKNDVAEAIAATNLSMAHLAKKSIRRGLRLTDKYIKMSGSEETEMELLIHFGECCQGLGAVVLRSRVMLNLFIRVLSRIEKAKSTLHADVQFDYEQRIAKLQLFGNSIVP